MEANELRVGNWVEVDFGASGKDIQQMDIATFEYCFNGGEGICKPIPLTEEWLLDFGFEKETSQYFLKEHEYTNFLLFFSQNHNQYWYFADVERRQYNSTLPIIYVHQLQNLYFALTGEELTLNR